MLAINCKRPFPHFFISAEDIPSVHGYIIPGVTQNLFYFTQTFEVTDFNVQYLTMKRRKIQEAQRTNQLFLSLFRQS